jgi:23S rRNA (uracil747-C5)-methyltransferase
MSLLAPEQHSILANHGNLRGGRDQVARDTMSGDPENGSVSRLQCAAFDEGRCASCTEIRTPYEQQVAAKNARAHRLVPAQQWLPPVLSEIAGFRTKAKFVVGGTALAPTLGILDAQLQGIDLSDCPVVDNRILAAVPAMKRFIAVANLVPYDIPARRGELKNVIVTVAPDGALMARFVLRSTEALSRLRKHLPSVLAELPQLHVLTANLLPEHKAVLEGDEELVLTETDALDMSLGDVTLHLLPHSFFQTNTAIAKALYVQGKSWVEESTPVSVWDLYCGVGGFALHVAHGRDVVGVEVSEEAVTSARRSAAEAGVDAKFVAADATQWARSQAGAPDLVIVNPPRRGVGVELAAWIEESRVPRILYSSCNVESLARDLAAMPSMTAARAQVFDMFPHTAHFETLVLLERAPRL